MLVDGFAAHGEDGAGLVSDGQRRPVVTEVVVEGFEVLGWRLCGLVAAEDTRGGRPLCPTWVFLPRYAIPQVEELHGAVRVGGDASCFGVEGYLLHLDCCQIGMVIDAALGE